MQRAIFCTLMLFLSISACKPSQSTSKVKARDGINFIKSSEFESVLATAGQENKLIFIEFYADWCVPCKVMEKEVFSDKIIGDLFNKNFVNYKINSEKGNGPDLAAILNVNILPTLLFLDEIGRVVERVEGSVSHSELISIADQALAQKAATGFINVVQE